MSIKTKFAALAVAAVVAAGAIASTTPAQAGGGGGGGFGPGPAVGLGIATGLVVGTAIAASQQPAYAYPVRRCFWQPQYNVFGQYVGSVRTCPMYY